MSYRLTIKTSAKRELRRLPAPVAKRASEAIESLAHNPRSIRSRKLSGHPNLYRVRLGDYRIIYSISDSQQELVVEAIRHRRDAYRNL